MWDIFRMQLKVSIPALPLMKQITKEDYNELNHEPTVIKFWADWCGPCKTFAPTYERIASQHPDIRFAAAELEPNIELARQYGVRSIPTVVYVERDYVKVMPANDLEGWLNERHNPYNAGVNGV